MSQMKKGLKLADIEKMQNVVFVDTRGESSFYYGHIPNAVCLSLKEIENFDFEQNKNYVLYCRNETFSKSIAESKNKNNVFYLKGGYTSWIKESYKKLNENEVQEKAELSIRKKFHKQLFSQFAKGIKEYNLIEI